MKQEQKGFGTKVIELNNVDATDMHIIADDIQAIVTSIFKELNAHGYRLADFKVKWTVDPNDPNRGKFVMVASRTKGDLPPMVNGDLILAG